MLPWQWIFALIAGCGLIGALGLAWWMPAGAGDLDTAGAGWRQLPVLFDRRLLAGASLPLLSYTGSFALYTFITPLLLQVTHADIRGASAILLAYGIGAAVGNIVGGRMTDRLLSARMASSHRWITGWCPRHHFRLAWTMRKIACAGPSSTPLPSVRMPRGLPWQGTVPAGTS